MVTLGVSCVKTTYDYSNIWTVGSEWNQACLKYRQNMMEDFLDQEHLLFYNYSPVNI